MCRVHGGGAPQTLARARESLALAADRMAANLLGMATDADSEAVQLAATDSALDRAGVTGKTAVELSVAEPKPWEQVFDGISPITRAEHQAQQGLPPPEGWPDLPPAQANLSRPEAIDDDDSSIPLEQNVIDAEVVPLLTMSDAIAATRAVSPRRIRR